MTQGRQKWVDERRAKNKLTVKRVNVRSSRLNDLRVNTRLVGTDIIESLGHCNYINTFFPITYTIISAPIFLRGSMRIGTCIQYLWLIFIIVYHSIKTLHWHSGCRPWVREFDSLQFHLGNVSKGIKFGTGFIQSRACSWLLNEMVDLIKSVGINRRSAMLITVSRHAVSHKFVYLLSFRSNKYFNEKMLLPSFRASRCYRLNAILNTFLYRLQKFIFLWYNHSK